ncbi:DUF4139 domain-containing protein [Sulfurovum mangrovi]|uniref:DUF4139 domain-containing protein n=1 Tax=Sulfurovum mangrovi TaxID=2893889 RepID=UPI001E40D28B|nr:DUF4139 domain-containing protein [Sulfurovum mangrovi]UFH60340.1 DUF4139 domain-containing protein [Sulfurovum mangrovi]
MKRILPSLSLLLITTLSHASSLQVYQDTARYTYSPKSPYLGMAEGVSATCQGQPLALEQNAACESDERLCHAFTLLQSGQEKLDGIKNNISLLDKIISLYRPTTLDARVTIDAAREIGSERAKLVAEHEREKIRFALQKEAFVKQTKATLPLYYAQGCEVPTELKFPYGSITFHTFYEADLSGGERVNVTQYLAVTNRSGVDISADEATFYARRAQRTVRPVHFHPWIISEYQPPLPRTQSLSKKSVRMMDGAGMEMMAEVSPAPIAEYVDAREYKARDLDLPSTGEAVNVKVQSWSAEMKCGLHLSPYANLSVYEACSFSPKTQIESHTWKIKEGEALITDRAFGEYREKSYHLYTKIDEDIKVTRRAIVRKEKDTGFFGNTVRKKDGYILTLTNKSDKDKSLTITERIPTSTTEEIEVKLLKISSDKKVDYRLLKEGKVEMRVVLAPGEEKTIEVLFEVAYDKERKVRY